jgi:very-short-patch-repair endonuclease
MRREPTRAEDRVWFWLRDRRCAGFKFRRQVPVGPYILDFYCVELKLAIELDGAHHRAAWICDYDGRRSLELEDHGIYVLRIPNELLIRNSRLVGEQIRAAIDHLREGQPPHPPSAPSPPCAGEKDLGGEERAATTRPRQ